MDAKNRRGTKAKLTFNQSEGIKKLLSERYKQVEVAKIFGVHQTTISRIYRNISQTFKTERN
jgi:DNA invertase Pin-like site-specific DNA recombinase